MFTYTPPLLFLLFSSSLLLSPASSADIQPEPDPEPIQPLKQTPSPPISTIPAFPEQSNEANCPLYLPNQLFSDIKSACSGNSGTGKPSKTKCCPVLAAWLYSAYSATALGSRATTPTPTTIFGHGTPSYDLPLLPEDSESCVNGLDKALKQKGIEIFKPNETCDAVYCYCGIRLHPLKCPRAFRVNRNGKIVGDNKSVKRLERDCLNRKNGVDRLHGCSKCLNSLNQLNKKTSSNSSKPHHEEDSRTTKMQNKDCQLMGLTWLLAKNHTAYIHTVTKVLRATMMSKDGSNPRSCTLNSDGLPLAVDSSDINDDQSSSIGLQLALHLYHSGLLMCLLSLFLIV